MGILVEKNEDRSRLQERITADLRERAATTSKNKGGDGVDLVEDSAYIEGTKASRGTAWFWITLIVLGFIALGIIFFVK